MWDQTVSDGKPHLNESGSLIHLEGFVRTMARRTHHDGIYPIYALHCNYCLTTSGPAIMRVVIISSDCEKIYETYVRQDNPIMQFDTLFVRISL